MNLIKEVAACTICKDHLPLGPRPVIRVHPDSKILIIGQAPGRKVHASGIPWDDASGKKLREWLGVDVDTFYDTTTFGIVPMGFCYPGTGTSGDLPPRPECAPNWHQPLLNMMPKIQLTLLFGMYARDYYLPEAKKKSLQDTVREWHTYLPKFLPMPHPSPRNRRWLQRNPWFEMDVVPYLKGKVSEILNNQTN